MESIDNSVRGKLKVGLFITCLVDLFRPSVGFASVKLLEQAGCAVRVPVQSCCGQVAFNSGISDGTKELAWQVVQQFSDFDFTVAPSGSCAGMIKLHYPKLFQGDERLPQVEQFCVKVYELSAFLVEVCDFAPSQPNCDLSHKKITLHDSCSGLREVNIKTQPRTLLKYCANVDVMEMRQTEECCGFGGTFSIKFPEVSNRMVSNKVEKAREVQAEMLLGGDLSCLLNIAGKIHRQSDEQEGLTRIEVRHVAEVLAGELEEPPLGG